MLNGCVTYKSQSRELIFPNSSRIVLGYLSNETDVLQYQGQSYDVIFMEEATQFTSFQFYALTESNRSSGMCKKKFFPRMYFTCNPGGVGHEWVKRLFIDRIYKNSEREQDYTFIRSGVYDNEFLLENSPEYIRTLESLPEKRKQAMLYGNWDIYEGQYFEEFDRNVHVIRPFEIPNDWQRYVSIDYGLDMLAALWVAVDRFGRAFVYREVYEKNLIVSSAAQEILKMSENEKINMHFAPPDLFSRRQESGKSVVDIFRQFGLVFYKTDNSRVNGWYELKEWLSIKNGEPKMKIFENCKNLIRTLPALTFDTKNPNDVASNPHELTHAPDALRGFVMSDAARVYKDEKVYENGGYESFLNYGI